MLEPSYNPGMICYGNWPTLTKIMIQLTWSDIHLCDKAMEDKLSLFPEERGEKDMYRNTINKQENN